MRKTQCLVTWLAGIVSLIILWTASASAATEPVSSWNSMAAQAALTALRQGDTQGA